jgi:hypothetical protein
MESVQARHGDVLLHPVTVTPSPLGKWKAVKKYVAALGEVTGHSHVIYGEGMTMLREKVKTQRTRRDPATVRERTYVNLPSGGHITHEEHGVIQLTKGIYEVIQQQEWVDMGWKDVRD